jgi:integrase
MAREDSSAYPPTKLTEVFIQSIGAPGKRIKVRDTTVPGLFLRVSANGKSKVFYVDYRTHGSRKRRFYKIGAAGSIALSAAKAEARKILGEVADRRDPAKERAEERAEAAKAEVRTLQAYLDGEYWTRHLSHQRTGKATQKRIRAAWRPFLGLDMEKLTPARLASYRARRLKEDGASKSSLNRDRTALLALLNAAVADGLLSVNPIAKFKPLKLEDDERVRYLGEADPAERERFMAAVERAPEYFAVMVKLALLTGMRRGEIFSLTWQNVDLAGGKLTVRASAAKSQRKRVIQLPPAAIDLLKGWRKAHADVVDIKLHVFLNSATGKPYTDIKFRWQALCRDAKIADFRFHDLRHDYASRLVQSGVDLYTVQKLLGHSSIEMTQRYAHLSDKGLQDAVSVLL